jgi:hypothetical protein
MTLISRLSDILLLGADSYEKIDPTLIQECRLEKRRLKLERPGSPTHQALSTCYDQATSNILLFRLLKSVSRKLRAGNGDPSTDRELLKTVSLLSSRQAFTAAEATAIVRSMQQNPELRKPLFDEMYATAVRIKSSILRAEKIEHITWFHGTKTGALPGIIASGGALLPMGVILEGAKTVSFCGEIFGNERSHNAKRISGEILSESFEESPKKGLYMDASTRFLTSFLYATKKSWNHGCNDKVFDFENAKKIVSVDFLETNWYDLSKKRSGLNNLLSGIKLAIFRLKQYDKQANSYLDLTKEWLKSRKGDGLAQELLEEFEKTFKLLTPEEKTGLIQIIQLFLPHLP